MPPLQAELALLSPSEVKPLVQQGGNHHHNKRASKDEESAEDEGSEDIRPETCNVNTRKVLFSLALCTIIPVVLLIALVLTINVWAANAIEIVASQVLGVETDIGSVNIALFSARSSVTDLKVGSPSGSFPYFLTLDRGLFDLKISSLLFSPLEMQDIELTDLKVSIDQQVNGDSNAKRIIDHIHQVTNRGNEVQLQDTVHTMTKKIMVDKLHFRNISTMLCVHPVCEVTGSGYFWIKEVQISDVGKNSRGVYLYELLEIIVQALVLAAIKAAPAELSGNLQSGLGQALFKVLDYQDLQLDVGNGLEIAGDWTNWQLNRLGNSTKYFGGLVAGALNQEGAVVSNAIDGVLGIQHPQDEVQQAMKNVIDQETGIVTQALAKAIENTTDVLSTEVDALGQNMSKTLEDISDIFQSMFGPPKSR